MSFIDQLISAPPSPSPGESSAPASSTPSPTTTMTQLPTTGPSAHDTHAIWGVLGVGMVLLLLGLVLLVVLRRARTKEA